MLPLFPTLANSAIGNNAELLVLPFILSLHYIASVPDQHDP